MSGGTFQVDRSIWDDPTFRKQEKSELEAFLWMTSEAAWKRRVRTVGSITVTCERGQLACATRFMAGNWMWSESKVRRFLNKLKNRRIIETKTDAGITVVTICNYDDIQLGGSESDAAATQQPTQQRRSSDANENTLKTIKTIDTATSDEAAAPSQLTLIPDEKPKPKRRSQFPESWEPASDLIGWAKAKGFSEVEIRRMAEHCVSHHRSKGNTFLDHAAAFRTWVQNQERFNPPKGGSPPVSGSRLDSQAESILRRRALRHQT